MRQIKFDKKKAGFVGFVSIMVLVFAGVMWWIFSPAKQAMTDEKKNGGLNTQLPGANVKKDSAKDKLSFYAIALSDSAKRAEEIRMDPNRRDTANRQVTRAADNTVMIQSRSIRTVTSFTGTDQMERVRSLQKQLAASTTNDEALEDKPFLINQHTRKIAQALPDPEMEAINATLDKIMAIQNPKSNTVSNTVVDQPGYSVSAGEETDATYFGKNNSGKSRQNFLGDAVRPHKPFTSLTANISGEQVLTSGATVKLELGSPVSVNGINVPANTAIYGIASIEGERLRIAIPSILYQNNYLPVSLAVYDLDGLDGIYIPGSVTRDVVKESAEGAIQSTGAAAFGLSLKTQVAAAGIGAAKSLLSKKVKQVRVTLTAGYKVFLRDTKQSLQ